MPCSASTSTKTGSLILARRRKPVQTARRGHWCVTRLSRRMIKPTFLPWTGVLMPSLQHFDVHKAAAKEIDFHSGFPIDEDGEE